MAGLQLRFSLLAAFLFPSLLLQSHIVPSPDVEVIEYQVDYLFNEWLHFTASFEASDVIQEAFVFYQFSGSDRSWVYEAEVDGNETLDVQVALGGEELPPPFTNIEYWFRFASDHGAISESPHYTLYYDDNRYAWQRVEGAPFTVTWHNGDEAFAASVLAAARQGVIRAQLWLPLVDPQAVTLRVYDNADDVQMIAQQAGFAWQAGHTDPAAGLILLSLSPDQSLEVQRQVPHELAHLMLYQSLGGKAYNSMPAWLNEGFATNIEVYSDPEHADLLDQAKNQDALIPLFSLCDVFPQDGASARLAYAEASSFVRYLYDRFNATGFGLLVDAYTQNPDCINAPVELFGRDLIGLDVDWRSATFQEPVGILDWLTAIPWLAILSSALVALALFGLLRFIASRWM